MKTTLKAVGLFLLITAAVTSGALISNHFIEKSQRLERLRQANDESYRDFCEEMAAINDPAFDEVKANFEAEGF